MIVIKDLTKKYGDKKVVDNLNLNIQKGEFFGLLGPNGAGKTTIIKMMTTLAKSTSGSITLDNIPIERNKTQVKSKIGVVPQHMNLDWQMSAVQNLELHGKLFGMEKKYMNERIHELLNYIDLYDRKDDIVNNLSGGMKRKLMIARALLHEPEVLLMDEPTVGLDVSVRRKLWDLMKGLNKNGMTVILTTHYIEEAEILCSRVGFMNSGKLIELDTPERLIRKSGQFVLEYFEHGETKTSFFQDRESALKEATTINSSVNIRPSNLEDTFIMLTNRKVGE